MYYLFTVISRTSRRRTRARRSHRALEPPGAAPSMYTLSKRPNAAHISSGSYSLDVQPPYQHAGVGSHTHRLAHEDRTGNTVCA